MPSLHSNRGAKRARQAREALSYTHEGPLPDVLHAIERQGGAHVVVLDLPEGVAGAYVAKAGCPLLFVNGRQAITRQRFTVAHEFGHFRMGHESVVDRQAAISGYDHDPTEVEANAFAAEFLMPKQAIQTWGATHAKGSVTLEHVAVLACEYGVSAQAARYALETAKVLTDSKRARQLDQEIAEEMHVAVIERLGLPPLNDELADIAGRLPRIPHALTNSALGDLLAGSTDVDGLAQRTSREPEQVRAMLAALGLEPLVPAAT